MQPRTLVPLALLLAACGSERASRARPGGCTPNQSVACVCAPGVPGVQVCQANFAFEPCQCTGFDAGFPADASATPDTGFGVDSGAASDAGHVDAQPRDFGTEDTGIAPDTGVVPDLGFPDAGFVDTGVHPDATIPDTGVRPDAGFLDTGVHPDATVPDTGVVTDAGVITDAGTPSCTQDNQCASGRCHPLYNQCVPVNRKLHCEVCTSDVECGLPADHCLSITIGGQPAETICAQGCTQDADCPRGYDCSVSNHCYPTPGSIRVHTCAALRDTLAGVPCDPFLSVDQCGLPNFDDATCVLGLGCSIGCASNVECPSGTSCMNWIVGSFCEAP